MKLVKTISIFCFLCSAVFWVLMIWLGFQSSDPDPCRLGMCMWSNGDVPMVSIWSMDLRQSTATIIADVVMLLSLGLWLIPKGTTLFKEVDPGFDGHKLFR